MGQFDHKTIGVNLSKVGFNGAGSLRNGSVTLYIPGWDKEQTVKGILTVDKTVYSNFDVRLSKSSNWHVVNNPMFEFPFNPE